jgi:hypothetical protein
MSVVAKLFSQCPCTNRSLFCQIEMLSVNVRPYHGVHIFLPHVFPYRPILLFYLYHLYTSTSLALDGNIQRFPPCSILLSTDDSQYGFLPCLIICFPRMLQLILQMFLPVSVTMLLEMFTLLLIDYTCPCTFSNGKLSGAIFLIVWPYVLDCIGCESSHHGIEGLSGKFGISQSTPWHLEKMGSVLIYSYDISFWHSSYIANLPSQSH